MGGAVSSGENNDELVTHLVTEGYILGPLIERVFRNVDRGHYFPESEINEKLSYKDVAWRQGNIHISAPCIYTEVMTNIDLKPGLSFLNIGSGTGYLSTMAGLLLGSRGINHGIEIHEDMVDYSSARVAEFMQKGSALDEFEFCEPQFVCGNGLLLSPDVQYDRIYCGAGCNAAQIDYMRGLLKVDGILIAPTDNELMRFHKISEEAWDDTFLLPVSFASILPVAKQFMKFPILPQSKPLSLKEICRFLLRAILREIIIAERPEALQCLSKKDWDHFRQLFPNDTSSSPEGFDSGIFGGFSTDSDSSSSECASPPQLNMTYDNSGPKFHELMEEKIKTIPLPMPLLRYLNFGRPIQSQQ